MRYPTQWRVEDLRVGKIIYNPPMAEVDPRTRQSTGRLQKFIVTTAVAGGFSLAPYHGNAPAEMPPQEVVNGTP